jgi:methionyl-tRNA formyltransferase
MRIVFMGTPDFSVPILKNLIKHYEVILVVTQPDKPVGRKRVLTASPVKDVAIEH